METHYRDEICVEDLASFLNLSTRQTNRFLREYMNINFNDFIGQYRIELAKTFFLEFNAPIKEILQKS